MRLAVKQRNFGILIEEVQEGCVEANGDIIAGASLAAGVNAGYDVAIFAGGGEVQIGFGAHQLNYFNMYVDRSGGILLEELCIVGNVLGTDTHVYFLANALVRDELLKLLCGNLNLVLSEYGEYVAAFLLQGYSEEVHLRGADEACNKQVGGIVIQILGGIYLLDEAILHNYDAGTHGHSLGLVVGYVDEGGLQSLMQLGDLSSHLNAELSIEVGKRFIHKEDLGLTNNCTAESNALTLTAGKSLGLALEKVLDIEDTGGFLNALVDLGFGGLAELKTKGHVVIYSHVRIQGVVLENHGDIAILGSYVVYELVADVKLAVGDLFKTCYHSKSGGLSAARGADQNDKFLIFDVEAEIAYSRYAAGIHLVNMFQSYACH